ncbi:MAG: 30S ribosomal protein S21 [Candidatus Marinamargulisbacteria bacterium]
MARQDKRKGESIDSLLRKFKRKIKNEGTLKELREREFFEKPSESKKKRLKAAVKRTQTEQRQNELI